MGNACASSANRISTLSSMRYFPRNRSIRITKSSKLTNGLIFLTEELGYNNPLVKKVLAGKSPSERASELVRGTKVGEVEFRKKLFEAAENKTGKEMLEKTKDPMLLLAMLVDPEARAVRKTQETDIEEVKRQAYAEIAKVKFALEGTSTYPDATFTLRLSFGQVKGFEENGKQVPFETTFAGAL